MSPVEVNTIIGDVMLRTSKVTIMRLQLVAGQLVADEEIVHQELQLVRRSAE